jgi:hypothetical protein
MLMGRAVRWDRNKLAVCGCALRCPPGWMLTCTNTQTHLTYVHARCANACHERAFNVHSCACSVPHSDPVTITVPVCHAGVMPGSSTLLNMPQYVKRRHALVAPSSIISLCLSPHNSVTPGNLRCICLHSCICTIAAACAHYL